MASIETLVQQVSSLISTSHSVGQTYLSLQSVTGFVAPGRVEVSTGVTKKVTLGYFSFTGIDSGLKRLTGISGTSGTVDLAIPSGAKVEQVFLDFSAGTGPQGPQGYQGANGSNGAQGAQGAAGTAGAQGPQGYQGANGSSGSNGAQGPQGFQGNAGSNGSQGNQGASGTAGVQGPQGFQGNQGAQGSGVAAGSGGQFQYNNSGAFAGTSGLTWNDSTKTALISGTTNYGYQCEVDPNTNYARGSLVTTPTASTVSQFGYVHLALLPSGGATATVTGFGSVINQSAGSPTSYCFWANNTSSNGYGVQSTGRGYFQTASTGHDTLTLQAQTSQTGKLLSFLNSSGTATSYVSTDGSVRVGDSAFLQVRNTQTNFPAEIWGPVGSPTLRIANAVSTTYPNNAWRIYAVDGNGMARLEATRTGTIVYADTFQIENNYQEQRYAMNRVISSSNSEKVGHLFRCDFDSSMTGTSSPVACQILINTDASTTTGVRKFLDCKTGGSSVFHVDKAGRVKIGTVTSDPTDSPPAGTKVFNTSNLKEWTYDGSTWRYVQYT